MSGESGFSVQVRWIISTCVAIVGGILGTAAYMISQVVSAEEFDKHLEQEERRYVLALKADIRDLKLLIAKDNAAGLESDWELDLEETIDELCELRPSDRYCQ